MSTDVSILLKMLEPAVRPGATGATSNASSAKAPTAPFEDQPFEQLLRSVKLEASGAPSTELTKSENPVAKLASPLAPLADFGRVENKDVRALLSKTTTQATTQTTTQPKTL